MLKMLPLTSLLTRQPRMPWSGRTPRPRTSRQRRRRRRTRRKTTRAGRTQPTPTTEPRVMAAACPPPAFWATSPFPACLGEDWSFKFDGFEVLFLTCFYFILANLCLWLHMCTFFLSCEVEHVFVLKSYFTQDGDRPVLNTIPWVAQRK